MQWHIDQAWARWDIEQEQSKLGVIIIFDLDLQELAQPLADTDSGSWKENYCIKSLIQTI
jgi:hypothetical protein